MQVMQSHDNVSAEIILINQVFINEEDHYS